MFHIGIIVYIIHYLCALRQFIAIIKSFKMFQNLEYIDFYINIIKSFHELRNDKYPADVTLITEDDIQVKAHKIILSSSSIKSILPSSSIVTLATLILSSFMYCLYVKCKITLVSTSIFTLVTVLLSSFMYLLHSVPSPGKKGFSHHPTYSLNQIFYNLHEISRSMQKKVFKFIKPF